MARVLRLWWRKLISRLEMMTEAEELNLEEFASATWDDWCKAAEESLKGAPLEKKLFTKTHEGILLKPIYFADDIRDLPEAWPGLSPYQRGSAPVPAAPWVAQEIQASRPEEFNKIALADLMRGQNALTIPLARVVRRGGVPDGRGEDGSGLRLASLSDAKVAFAGIEPAAIKVVVGAGFSAVPILGLLEAHSREWSGAVMADPLGEYAWEGRIPMSLQEAWQDMASAVRWSRAHGERFRTVGVQASVYAEAGGTNVEELGFGLATAVEYLRAMEAMGVAPVDAAGQFAFVFSLGSHFFMQIAKLRAARLLWSRVQEACGLEPRPAFIHARCSQFNKSRLDLHTNMLRVAAEAFAGVAGGADSLHVAAYDELLRVPNEFSRRISRNVQIILSEECGMRNVADPAGGSWFIERLTYEMAAKAWELFQKVEGMGGMAAALQRGFPQETCANSANARLAAVAQRRDGFIGVNLFPNPEEAPFGDTGAHEVALDSANGQREPAFRDGEKLVLPRTVEAATEAFSRGATMGEITHAMGWGGECMAEIAALRPRRVAEGYERLRLNSWKAKQRSGSAPTVWLANFGPAKQHRARADFSAGFFAAGGFEVKQGAGANTAGEAARAALESQAPVVVLCSTDETYPQLVPETVSAIKAERPETLVILAGYPPEHVEAFRAAGIDDFIHIRLNCLEFLTQLQQRLGIFED